MKGLQYLLDRREIEDLLVAYCNAIDQHDWDALDEIFTIDAEIDYTALGGPKDKLQAIKIFLDTSLPGFKHKQHIIANMQIALAVICPLLSGPKLMIFWITKETRNAEQEASPGRDYRQAA